jgi:hypothetical protein
VNSNSMHTWWRTRCRADCSATPLGVRRLGHLPRRPRAKGQGDNDKEPKKGVVYKVFVTHSFGVHAAIKEGVCYVNR